MKNDALEWIKNVGIGIVAVVAVSVFFALLVRVGDFFLRTVGGG